MNKKGCEGCSSVILFVIFCLLTIFAFQMSSTPPVRTNRCISLLLLREQCEAYTL